MRAKLRIEKLVYGGTGLAHHGETAVFVPFVLPGEEVEVEFALRGGVGHGAPVSWEHRSDERADPPCQVFGKCGGCQYQHVPYARQLTAKREILRETLQRIGGLSWEGEIAVEAAEPWGYRNRSQLRFARRNGGGADTGFLASGTHRLVPAAECPINSPALNRAHRTLSEMAASSHFPRQLRQIELFTNEAELQVNLPRRPGPVPKRFRTWCADRLGVARLGAPLTIQNGTDSYRVGGRSFFQVNRFLAGRLAEVGVGDSAGDFAVDLYCGVGLLTLPLARRFRRVVGVESGGPAARDLQSNVARAGLSVHAVQAEASDYLKGLDRTPDVIVADPPRTGLGMEVVEQIVRLGPPQLRLLSCNPATLARDLKGLLAGGYAVETLTMVDMFPQTLHVETVAQLRRRKE